MMSVHLVKKSGLMRDGKDFAPWSMKDAISTRVDVAVSVTV